MKKIYLTFLIFAMAKLTAQPVISANHAIQPGTTTYQHADASSLGSLTPGPAGANVSWDFSQYSSAATTSQTMYNCPGNTNCSSFPGANKMIGSNNGNSYSYLSYSNNELSTLGSKNTGTGGTTLYTFDNPKLELKFPVTYLQSFTDSWTGYSTPAGTSETGSHTITVDAYGTLKTPLGTFPNTLRIKRVLNVTNNTTGSPAINSVVEMYTWISADYSGTLLTIGFADVTITGSPTTHTRSFTYGNNNLVLSVENVKADQPNADVYPNPGSDFITVSSREIIDKMELTNAEGRKVGEVNKTEKINISGLPAGVYYLKIDFKHGKTQTKKVIKK